MMPRVYLAGPISGLTHDESTAWRNQAVAIFAESGIRAYSPMRNKEFLSAVGVIEPDTRTYPDHPLATDKGIMMRDFNDCISADALLVNFAGVTRISLGSAMELGWSYDRHIPVVVVSEPDNPNVVHPMMREAIDYRVNTLAEGIALIKTILLPGGMP